MAKYLGPIRKYLRRFGLVPGGREKIGRRKTDYGRRLEAKQKIKFMYGVLDKQFEGYARQALTAPDPENFLLTELETRLDNVLYKAGFTKSIRQARQIVNHRQVKVNGKKVNIPSYNVKPDQVISLDVKLFNKPFIQENLQLNKNNQLPSWLDITGNSVKVLHLPEADDLPRDVDISKVLELYT